MVGAPRDATGPWRAWRVSAPWLLWRGPTPAAGARRTGGRRWTAGLLLASSSAFGHAGGTISTVDIEPSTSGSFVQASFGLVTQRSVDAPFEWTCHEAVTTPDALITPRYVQVDGGVLAVVPASEQARDAGETVYRSSDGGCSWSPVAGLTGQVVARVAVDPGNASRAIAVTVDPAPGAVNGAWVSTDAGRSWTPTDLARGDALFLDVHATEDAVWTSSVSATGDAAIVHVSVDFGASWTSTPADLAAAPREGSTSAEPVSVRILTVKSAREAYLLVDPLLGDTLLRTIDGGVSWAPVLSVGGELVDAEVHSDGTVWVVEANRFLYRSADGGPFAKVADATFGVGLGLDASDVHLGGFPELVGALVLASPGGAGPWNARLLPHEIGALHGCPAESDHARACSPLWDELKARLDRFTPAVDTGRRDSGLADGGDRRDKPGGCGCESGESSAGWLAVLIMAAGVRPRSTRRRRTRDRPGNGPRSP